MGQNTNQLTGGKPGEVKSEQIRADMARTRAEMGQTIEALHGRLNPVVLKEQAIESFREVKETVKAELKEQYVEAKEKMKVELTEAKATVKAELAEAKENVKAELVEAKDAIKTEVLTELDSAKAAVHDATIGKVKNMISTAQDTAVQAKDSLVDVIKANPIPVALIGTGLAWLWVGARQKRLSAEGPVRTRGSLASAQSGRERGFIDTVSAKASDLGDSLSGAAHQVASFASDAGSKISDVTQQAAAKAGEVAQETGATVSRAAHDAGAGVAQFAQRTGQRGADTFQANPVAVGAAALAIGTAIGLSLPSTRREDELMGEFRDGLLSNAGDMAHGAFDNVKDAAQQFAETSMTQIGSAAKQLADAGLHAFDQDGGREGMPTGAQEQSADRSNVKPGSPQNDGRSVGNRDSNRLP